MPRGVYDRKAADIPDEEDTLVMSVKLKSGRFESSIEVPLYATDKDRESFIEQWLNLMEAGIKCGSEYRNRKAKTDAL